MTRQVEVDVKAAQRIGTQHSVKWPREHARHIDRSNAHPAPRYRHSADGKAAQLHLAGLEGAANPAYLPLEFDTRALRADSLGYGGRQDRPFGAGVEDQRHRHPVRRQRDDRRVAQGRNRHFAQANRRAAAAGCGDRVLAGISCGRHQRSRDNRPAKPSIHAGGGEIRRRPVQGEQRHHRELPVGQRDPAGLFSGPVRRK